MSKNIVLDPKIRDWVLMPIVIVMILQGVLRQYVSVLLTDEKKANLPVLQKTLLLRRSNRLRANSHIIPLSSFKMRKAYFIQKAFRERSSSSSSSSSSDDANNPNTHLDHNESSNTPNPFGNNPLMGGGSGGSENPMQDPFAMVGMMKQNMAMIVPNMLLMGWVSYFFSGFVLVKLPFGSSDRFKSMLQRGIFLRSLDPSYVSSLSWYFINLFGLRGLFSLILGDNNVTDNAKMMQDQMSGTSMPQMDFNQLFSTEKTELEIIQHEWSVAAAEFRIIGKHS